MGKASSAKRAVRTGRAVKKTEARKKTPWGWYSFLSLVVIAGVAGVALTAGARVDAGAGPHPNANDHWHAAYGIYVCDKFEPDLPQPDTLIGLHTHGDGLIHVEPFTTNSLADAGSNATLARFVTGEPGLKLSSSMLQYPGAQAKTNGGTCGDQPAAVRIRVWPSASGDSFTDYTNPKDVRIQDGQAITIAYAPAGADIPKPASIPKLANPNAAGG